MRRLEAGFQRVLDALAMLAGAIFAAVALLIPLDVTLRACCAASIYGLLDAIEYGLLAATFLAAPWVLSRNAHVTVDIATLALPVPIRHRLAVATSLMGAAISAVFCWYATEALAASIARGSMIRTAFVIPEWWVLTPPVIATALLALEFLRRIAHDPREDRAASGL